ncbi:MAG: N,N-dimethylformamidase beta subunit family domain-containing protein, partial [Acidimicrobiales bacterium]
MLTFLTLLLLPAHLGKGTGSSGKRGATTTATTKPAGTLANTTFGVQASWVVGENAKAGTNAWQLPPNQTGTTIAGYADHTSATQGQNVTLFISTSAANYHIVAYRMGYYGGKGGRVVWSSAEQSGVSQASCPVTAVTNMVSCSWQPSISVPITSSWPQGDYLLVLTADPGQSTYVPLTVIDPSSHGTYLVVNSLLTWQAWNT